MKQSRFDGLSDGIFAIVITLLAFDLRLPDVTHITTDTELWHALTGLTPIFISFILSFTLLFTYWRAHHYIASVYAKNVDTRLTNINAAFFFFITTIPFSTRLLGQYSNTHIAIIVYGCNVIAIGLTLLWMRHHVLYSGHIEREEITELENARGLVRTIVPLICAVAAIILSIVNTELSFILFTFAIVFNLMSYSVTAVNWSVKRIWKNREMIVIFILVIFFLVMSAEIYIHLSRHDLQTEQASNPASAIDFSTPSPIHLSPQQ